MPSINYVKFQRGLTSAYNSQKERGILDNNTLYFIYDSATATSGKLYLGEKLISGVGSGTSVTSLRDLTDVIVDTTASAGSILVLNSEGKWVTSSVQDIADLIASQQPLGFQVDNNVFNFTTVDGSTSLKKLNLNGFADAANGTFAMKGSDGKLAWNSLPVDLTELDTKVASLETELDGIHQEILDSIASAGHLKYEKVETISQAINENIIYLIPKENGTQDAYDEYMIVNGELEKLGDWGVDLSNYATTAQLTAVDNKFDNYVTKTVFNNTVGDLTQLVNYTTGNTIVDEINNINERLIWQEMG